LQSKNRQQGARTEYEDFKTLTFGNPKHQVTVPTPYLRGHRRERRERIRKSSDWKKANREADIPSTEKGEGEKVNRSGKGMHLSNAEDEAQKVASDFAVSDQKKEGGLTIGTQVEKS